MATPPRLVLPGEAPLKSPSSSTSLDCLALPPRRQLKCTMCREVRWQSHTNRQEGRKEHWMIYTEYVSIRRATEQMSFNTHINAIGLYRTGRKMVGWFGAGDFRRPSFKNARTSVHCSRRGLTFMVLTSKF